MQRNFWVKILIKDQKVQLQLFQEENNEVLDELGWQEENNLSLKLLLNIDNLLQKNKIKKEQLNNIEVDSDEATYSSTRIARTVARAGHYCLTN